MWLGYVAAIVVLATLLTWALHREMARIEREARMREFLATNPAALRLRFDFEAMARAVGEAFLPALQAFGKAIGELDPRLRALGEARERYESDRKAALGDFGLWVAAEHQRCAIFAQRAGNCAEGE